MSPFKLISWKRFIFFLLSETVRPSNGRLGSTCHTKMYTPKLHLLHILNVKMRWTHLIFTHKWCLCLPCNSIRKTMFVINQTRIHRLSETSFSVLWGQNLLLSLLILPCCLKPCFLAHLSWKLKWSFLIACRPSVNSCSPVPLGQFQSFSNDEILKIFSRTTRPNSTQLGTFWGEVNSSLFKWRATPFSKGR